MNGMTEADQRLVDSPSAYRAPRAAVVLFKVCALLYFLIGAYGAISAYSKASDQYDRDQVALATAPYFGSTYYPTSSDKPSAGVVLVLLAKDAFVAFFVFVAGDVIKLQLETKAGIEDARIRVSKLSTELAQATQAIHARSSAQAGSSPAGLENYLKNKG